MPNSVEIVQTTAEICQFSLFNMAAAAILTFQNFKFLTVGTVKKVERHQRTKFCQNRSKCGRYMAIFRFFQDGGRLPSWICNACFWTTNEGHLVVFIAAKFGWNPCSSFDNMHVFRFREFCLKTPIYAPKLLFDPLNWSNVKNSQKGTSLRESASFVPSCVKIHRRA